MSAAIATTTITTVAKRTARWIRKCSRNQPAMTTIRPATRMLVKERDLESESSVIQEDSSAAEPGVRPGPAASAQPRGCKPRRRVQVRYGGDGELREKLVWVCQVAFLREDF